MQAERWSAVPPAEAGAASMTVAAAMGMTSGRKEIMLLFLFEMKERTGSLASDLRHLN
ncbi:hypothetical protein [Methylosinus sp. Sm6]|uniref:hypothetical protein n=1 Tax=Methylosinus sp. Sm6 TaxID=2866948 RepID=UPI001C99D934|nr:hypothetical protein [Methylosinus sp. Sm6]MBY6241377.1 hypothetical protein [Methylosinus sp. Sm6]